MINKVLGRGLESLLNEEIVPIKIKQDSNLLKINEIEPNKQQPRKFFSEDKLQELANSIINNGVVQPIIVNEKNQGKYQIIAGERRYRACIIAGLEEIPAIIKKTTKKESLELALIENIQREQLTIIEEAESFKNLIDQFGYTPSTLSEKIGKSRSHITNILRLNSLSSNIKFLINQKKLSMGHARCLVGISNAEKLAQTIIDQGLNVRQTEILVNKKNNDISLKAISNNKNDNKKEKNDYTLLGNSLSKTFGTKVIIENNKNKGKIILHYSSLEELDLILMKLH